jgi:hypothetical protein
VFSHKGSTKRIEALIDNRIEVKGLSSVPPGWECDYYVTTAGLTSGTERAAARMGATVVVLPEAGDWLAERVAAMAFSGVVPRIFLAERAGDTP